MKAKQLILLVILCSCTISGFAATQGNPFTSQRHETPATAEVGEATAGKADVQIEAAADLLTAIRSFILNAQGIMNRELGSLVRQVQPGQGEFSWQALWLLLGLAALYGIFHALGPGHGKSIAGAWFLNRPASLANGLQLGFLMAGVHFLIAGGLVFTILLVLQLSLSTLVSQVSWWMGAISFSLLAALALAMVIGAVVELASGGKRHLHFHLGHKSDEDHGHCNHDHHHGEADHPAENPATPNAPPAKARLRELAVLAFVSVAIPCPGAIGIMILANGLGLLVVGLLAVAALSIGMGITTSGAGMIGILVRRGIIKGGSAISGRAANGVAGVLRLLGSLILLAIALSLALTQFSA